MTWQAWQRRRKETREDITVHRNIQTNQRSWSVSNIVAQRRTAEICWYNIFYRVCQGPRSWPISTHAVCFLAVTNGARTRSDTLSPKRNGAQSLLFQICLQYAWIHVTFFTPRFIMETRQCKDYFRGWAAEKAFPCEWCGYENHRQHCERGTQRFARLWNVILDT